MFGCGFALASALLLLISVSCAVVDSAAPEELSRGEVDDGVSLLQAEVAVQAREKGAAKQRKRRAVTTSLPEEGDGSGSPSSACEAAFEPASELSSAGASTSASIVLPSVLLDTSAQGMKTASAIQEMDTAWMTLAAKLVFWFVALEVVRRVRERFHKRGEASEDEAPVPEDAWQALSARALAGDVEGSRALIGSGQIDLQRADAWGCSLLHAAAKGGATQVVDLLLQQRAGVGERDAWDETPLHLAARAGHAQVCDLLLEHGAEVDAENAQEWTPLFVAADANHEVTCRRLLGRGAGYGGLEVGRLPATLKRLLAEGTDDSETMGEPERVSLVDLMIQEQSDPQKYARAEDDAYSSEVSD